MTQEERKLQRQNDTMITVSWVASKFIWNMDDLKTKKNICEIYENDVNITQIWW
jgi:hypothetical protein